MSKKPALTKCPTCGTLCEKVLSEGGGLVTCQYKPMADYGIFSPDDFPYLIARWDKLRKFLEDERKDSIKADYSPKIWVLNSVINKMEEIDREGYAGNKNKENKNKGQG